MKIGLVTNWGDHCSIAEYAYNLIQHLPRLHVEIDVISHPLTAENIVQHIKGKDIIHFNYIGYWMAHDVIDQVISCKTASQKVVVTYQETPPQDTLNRSRADRIVLHEPSGDYGSKVVLIPNGIRLVNIDGIQCDLRLIGSAGFAAPHKRFDMVAEAADRTFGFKSLLLMPQAVCYASADDQAKALMHKYDSTIADTSWLPYDDVVKKLAGCCINVFPYDTRVYSIGIGNAVRFALAAKRPVIVTKGHSHFRDLVNYGDEVYFMDNDNTNQLVELIAQISSNYSEAKVPNKLLQDMSWNRCAEMYINVYKEIV